MPGKYQLACFCLALLGCHAIGHAAPILEECGYYKLDSGSFISKVDRFLTAVEMQAAANAGVKQALSAGQDITQQLYSAGILGRVQGCSHGNSGSNIEVHGGNVLQATGRSAAQLDGFTMVIRALPGKLCNAVKDARKAGRTISVRSEIPGKPPGSFGKCIRNPITPLITLGKTLPEPNTAYIFQTRSAAQQSRIAPVPLPNACKGDLYLRADAIRKACGAVSSSNATPAETATCKSGLARQHAALLKVQKLDASGTLNSMIAADRVVLIEDLMAAYLSNYIASGKPQYTGKDVLSAVHTIYLANRNNNIDNNYFLTEYPRYQKIAKSIKTMLVAKGFPAGKLALAHWLKQSGSEKQSTMQWVSDITLRTLGSPTRSLIWQAGMGGGEFIPSESNVIRYNGATLLSLNMKSVMTTVLEEAVHVHQFDLSVRVDQGQIPASSHQCIQARLFLANWQSYAKGSLAWPFDYAPPFAEMYMDKSMLGYYHQPLEHHAKLVATYIAGEIFKP